MKKFLFAIVLLVFAVAGFDYLNRPASLGENKGLENQVKDSGIISEIKKQISTSGPLRAQKDDPSSYLTRAGTIIQTNLQRQQNGLTALTENQELNKAALAKVKDMFAGQYFEHISPTGAGPSDLAEEVGYEYIAVGENLALGNFKNDEELVIAWMNSPGHRENILSPKYTQIGVAVLKGTYEGRTTWLAVQEFGKPESACPIVDSNLKAQIELYKNETNILKPQIDSLRNYLDTHDPKTKQEVEEYNQKVAEFNNLVKIYNNKVDWLKTMTAQYNEQVNAFNACVGS